MYPILYYFFEKVVFLVYFRYQIMNITKYTIVIFAVLLSANVLANPPTNFSKAKKLSVKIYQNHQVAFYSNCTYHMQGKKLVPSPKTCGYIPRKNLNRGSRIEWEHIVPASHFGQQLQCWQNGGRRNCKKISKKFRLMEADLMNLVPTIGELNADRSNFRLGMISGEKRAYGKVDFEVDFKRRIAEPRKEIRGDIARIYFYMVDRYKLKISRSQKRLFKVWAKNDPISRWEIEKKKLIKSVVAVKIRSKTKAKPSIKKNSKNCNTAKKYCSHMINCKEAYFYLNQCGRIRLDGNKDGIPCNKICR